MKRVRKYVILVSILIFIGAAGPAVETGNIIPPVIAEIAEIEYCNCENRYLYLRAGKNTKWLRPGLYGLIYKDREFEEVLAKIEIVEVYSKISKARFIRIDSAINQEDLVKIELPPCYYLYY